MHKKIKKNNNKLNKNKVQTKIKERKRIFKKILRERTGICIADYKMQEEGILFDESEWCMALGDLYR
jgi:hypothetical protein